MRYPSWLKKNTSKSSSHKSVKNIINDPSIHTVCESALCPNRGECFSKNTVTFMILGNSCTRTCKFCAVAKTEPEPLDNLEPQKVASAAEKLKLEHVVITSVTRDDLADGGAEQFRQTILSVQQKLPTATIEVLTPDFNGNIENLRIVLSAKPTVFNHNVETVQRLYAEIRPQANLQQSLAVLKYAKENSNSFIKSGFMLGLGETEEEIKELLLLLSAQGVDIVTIGQYIAPSKTHAPVKAFIPPEKFAEYKQYGETVAGIKQVFAGPFVRSSYLAKDTLATLKK